MKKFMVSVNVNYTHNVEVAAASMEEAKEIAKYEIDKCYEYMDFEMLNENAAYANGCNTITVIDCVEA